MLSRRPPATIAFWNLFSKMGFCDCRQMFDKGCCLHLSQISRASNRWPTSYQYMFSRLFSPPLYAGHCSCHCSIYLLLLVARFCPRELRWCRLAQRQQTTVCSVGVVQDTVSLSSGAKVHSYDAQAYLYNHIVDLSSELPDEEAHVQSTSTYNTRSKGGVCNCDSAYIMH